MIIRYINSIGSEICFSRWPIAIDDVTPLFSKTWNLSTFESMLTNSSRLDRIYRTSKEMKVIAQVFADSDAEYRQLMKQINDVTEIDLIHNKPGKLYVDEYYLECYINIIEPKEYDDMFHYIDNEMTITSVYPHWIKEITKSFYVNSEIVLKQQEMNQSKESIQDPKGSMSYPYGYPYRYHSSYAKKVSRPYYGYNYAYGRSRMLSRILNENYAPSGFHITVFGPCINPEIFIGMNRYLVYTTIGEGEYLTICSRTREIIKHAINGVTVDVFNSRDKERNVFELIPPGCHTVGWNNQFAFDFTLYNERSEPVWS